MQETDSRIYRALKLASGGRPFSELSVLEIGCGSGDGLLRFLRWGVDPARLVGNELLESRAKAARRRLPESVRIEAGDAREMGGSFDVVFQSMVLSSLLDPAVRRELAQTLWRLSEPGGCVISYDFAYDNPRNRAARRVRRRDLVELFPDADVRDWKVTLAPPIARATEAASGPARRLLRGVPFLRTHRVTLIVRV